MHNGLWLLWLGPTWASFIKSWSHIDLIVDLIWKVFNAARGHASRALRLQLEERDWKVALRNTFNMATVNRVFAMKPSRNFNKTVVFPTVLSKLMFWYNSFQFLFFLWFGLQLVQANILSCSCVSRLVSSLSSEKKSFIAEGPSLGEFVSGEVSPQDNPYKRKKGQRYAFLVGMKSEITNVQLYIIRFIAGLSVPGM